jgi:ABC-2 type transport system ATP-binding protein
MSTSKHTSHYPLIVENLCKRFKERSVLTDVHMDISPGKALALLGVNGAGKSTMLRCIVGVMSKDEGSIRICGSDIDGVSMSAKAHLGYAPDEPFLYPYLTGYEHLRLWSAFRRLQADALMYGQQLAEALALTSGLHQQTRIYSRGMRQKLALIGSLFHKPELIVLDEPFTAMDESSTSTAIHLLQDAQNRGSGILFTSHQHDIVEQLATCKVSLYNGVVSTYQTA